MKKIILSLLTLATLITLTACGNEQTKSATSEKAASSTKAEPAFVKSATPTVYFHGYSGTINSFGGMIHRLQAKGLTKKEMIITVQPDGTLQTQGKLEKKKDNPSIQVLFADNQNNEWNQTDWIYDVMRYLKKSGIEQINVVGHSMGGVSSLRYLVTYGQPQDAPKIKKMITIGSPFNDFNDTSGTQTIKQVLQNGPTPESSRYHDYAQNIDNVPKNISILMMGGQLNDQTFSDGTVPITSALGAYALLKEHGNPISYRIIKGEDAHHSQLHENPTVDRDVANFLWEAKP